MSIPIRRFWKDLRLGNTGLAEVGRAAWQKTSEHDLLTRAGAIGFYAALSFVPVLILVAMITPQLLPAQSVNKLSLEQNAALRETLPADLALLLKEETDHVRTHRPAGLLSVTLLMILWSASSVFLTIITTLNRLDDATEHRSYRRLFLQSIGMTLVQSLILMGSLLALVAGPEMGKSLGFTWSFHWLVRVLHAVVIFCALLLSFALAYHVAFARKRRWTWISPGSLLGSICLFVVSLLFRAYVQSTDYYSFTYGSLAGIMMLLLWFWLASFLLLLGGAINKVVEDTLLDSTETKRAE